ncbi:MAG: hypothetical protein ACO1N3_03160 [Gammaproteobacteria bacterium]
MKLLKKIIKKINPKYCLIFGAYCLLTICAIYFSTLTKTLAGWVVLVDVWLDHILAEIMNTSALGLHLRHILTLALTPLVIVAIPVGIYWLIKKKLPSYLIQIIWVLWIITALSRLLSQ